MPRRSIFKEPGLEQILEADAQEMSEKIMARVRAYMQATGEPTALVAVRAGLTREYLQRMLSLREANPTLKTVAGIARSLGLRVRLVIE